MTATVPELVAAPGMTLAQVERRSSARLSVPRELAGIHVAQALQVHRFVVDHGAHTLTLGPGRVGFLQLRDAVVECVRVSPHIEYLAGPACAALLDECAAALDAAQWRREGSYSGEQAYARAAVVEEVLAGTWHTEHMQARLTLRRIHTPDSAAGRLFGLTQDVFVATLRIGSATR